MLTRSRSEILRRKTDEDSVGAGIDRDLARTTPWPALLEGVGDQYLLPPTSRVSVSAPTTVATVCACRFEYAVAARARQASVPSD
jgi:hypothetical protein